MAKKKSRKSDSDAKKSSKGLPTVDAIQKTEINEVRSRLECRNEFGSRVPPRFSNYIYLVFATGSLSNSERFLRVASMRRDTFEVLGGSRRSFRNVFTGGGEALRRLKSNSTCRIRRSHGCVEIERREANRKRPRLDESYAAFIFSKDALEEIDT